jgi:hypothetical protein
LGDITKEIYNIAEKYILNAEERREKLQQLQDNKVRLIQEQARLEDEKHTFFGLDWSENVIKKELEDATNIHLSAEAIVRLVETYLEIRLGGSKTYILGEGKTKTLRLNEDNRRDLLEDFYKIDRQANHVYKEWEQYLNESQPFEKITFDGKYASENKDVVFIMPTHPLVKQALKCFEEDPVRCSLSVKTDKVPAGKYPFLIYEWLYKGVKPDNKLQVITLENIPNNIMLELLYNATTKTLENVEIEQLPLEALHYKVWEVAKEEYLNITMQIIGFKKESLISSQAARSKALKELLKNATDPNIIRMRNSQLAKQEREFNAKMEELTQKIQQSDIVTKKLVIGIVEVEN